jgi:hypothetical protein
MSASEYEYSSGDDGDVEMRDATGMTSASATTTTRTPVPANLKLNSSVGSSGSTPLTSVRKRRQHTEYHGLSPADLQAEQDALTSEVAEVLAIAPDHASVLLLKYKWNKEPLFDAFYSNPGSTRFVAGAIQGPIRVQERIVKGGGVFWCNVLYDSVPYEQTFSMGCEAPGEPEHRFSLDAWQSYLMSQVGEGMACLFTQCQMRRCKCVVSPRVWRLVLGSSAPDTHPDEAQARRRALAKCVCPFDARGGAGGLTTSAGVAGTSASCPRAL